MSTACDPRELIKQGREHDEAMTPGCWYQIGYDVAKIRDDPGGMQIAGTNARVDAAGIAWLRTNLAPLLDALERALDENDRMHRLHGTEATQRNRDLVVQERDRLSATVANLRAELAELAAVIAERDAAVSSAASDREAVK